MSTHDGVDVWSLLTPDNQTTAKRLRGIYTELNEEAGITVRCEACTTEPLTPEVIVANFPRSWDEQRDARLLCQDCWAAEAAAHTSLEEAEAEVLALRWAGLEIPEMASATGLSEREVEERLRELHTFASEIESKREAIVKTGEVLEALERDR